jgi:hypothetical protein
VDTMTTDHIIALEHRRDLLASRIKRIAEEPERLLVESFEYQRKEHASRVRLALVRQMLRNIDSINEEIGKLIAVRV